jgi:hypothetical protein
MRRLLMGFAALGALSSLSGCMYMVATPSVQGRAFVVRNAMVSSDFWNCDATAGDPVCYQTQKANLPPGTNK